MLDLFKIEYIKYIFNTFVIFRALIKTSIFLLIIIIALEISISFRSELKMIIDYILI
jgi:hypothetical protein